VEKGKWWLIGLATIVLIILGIGGKQYMDKKAIEKDYQQGIDLIQKYVSNYLVENYEGIEKIEWQGVGVEWRNAKGYGTSLLGNYVDSKAKIFISTETYFTLDFTLTDETEYDQNLKKYVIKESLNSENVDSLLEMELRNTTRNLDKNQKAIFKKISKNNLGNTHAQVIYNTQIHELNY
jgi:hypothetical protein